MRGRKEGGKEGGEGADCLSEGQERMGAGKESRKESKEKDILY